VASYALAIDQGRTSTRAMLFGPTRRSPSCGNGSSAAGLGRSAGCWPEGGRKAPVPLACRAAMAPTGNTARRCCACQKQPVQDVMFCQPYNVVTRWRSVSLGLYSYNGAALRVLSA
jgi:hypothetical protein